jgi:hypothetical protein
MVLDSITRTRGWSGMAAPELQALIFSAVTDGSEENKKFFAMTPSGRLEVSTVNAEAVKDLVLGKSYYIDIVESE